MPPWASYQARGHEFNSQDSDHGRKELIPTNCPPTSIQTNVIHVCRYDCMLTQKINKNMIDDR